jgi:hypothetical protein
MVILAHPPTVAANPSTKRPDGVGVQRPLDRLDALVQRVDSLSPGNRTGTAGQDGPGIHLQGGHVDGGPVSVRPGGQGIGHGVPSGERGQQCGMGVEDPSRVGGVDRLAEHGAEPGHHHHVDVRAQASSSVSASV